MCVCVHHSPEANWAEAATISIVWIGKFLQKALLQKKIKNHNVQNKQKITKRVCVCDYMWLHFWGPSWFAQGSQVGAARSSMISSWSRPRCWAHDTSEHGAHQAQQHVTNEQNWSKLIKIDHIKWKWVTGNSMVQIRLAMVQLVLGSQ